MLQTNAFQIESFSGGMTDHFFSSDTRKAVLMDNFTIESNESLLTRPGSTIDDSTNGQIPAGAQRIGCIINYDNSTKLFVQSSKKFYYRNPSAYSTLTGPSGNDVFSTGTTNSSPSFTQWNKHIIVTNDDRPIPMKIYKDGSGNYQVRNCLVPALATPPTVTAGAAGANNYLYAFHYYYEYIVGAQTFSEAGPITVVELLNSDAPDSTAVAITAIPVITNGATNNWDTANIKVKIFRTINNGTENFFVAEVTNGTTTYNDTSSDSMISDNELIYAADGSVDFEPPPESKYVHVVNNTAYYAVPKEGSEEYPSDIVQSIPFTPYAVSLDFRDTVEDEITGLSSVQSIPIVLCKRHIYRIEGQLDQFGRGIMSHVRLSDTAGCVSNLSCVQAEQMLFWAGNDGFYVTDGYKVTKISDGNNNNYKALLAATTMSKRIYGKFDEANRRILWAVQSDSSSLDNDSCWVLDLRWGIKPDSVITSWSGTSFAPSALEFYNGSLYRADKRGYVFIHDPEIYTDPKIDTSVLPSTWVNETIIYNYLSLALNFSLPHVRKWVTKMLLTARNINNVSIQINAFNDDGKIERNLKEIRWRRNLIWGDPDFTWGDPACIWGGEGLIEEYRRFPAKGLRLSYLQVQITNAYTVITNSDTLGTATFNNTTNQALIDDSVNVAWPEDCVDYYISTEADNYDKQYQISARSADTLTVIDASNTFPNGSLQWQIKGYRKNEALNLLSLVLYYAGLTDSHKTYQTGEDGSNI